MKFNHNGHVLEFFDDISQLPIVQFHLFSKYCLVSNGIGDSIASVNNHIEKIVSYIKGNNMDSAIAELKNYQKNLFMVANSKDIRHKAFLCLIKTVDGERWEDYSEEGIDRLYDLILTVPEKEMTELEAKLNKAIEDALIQYFPDLFSTAMEKNYEEILKRRAYLQLSEIIDRDDHHIEIDSLNARLLGWYSPKKFEGKDNAEVEFDRQFEKMCLYLSKEFGGTPKKYTVMEFYSANSALQEQSKKLKKIKK